MSSFGVYVREITVLPHPNADRLECAKIDDYFVVIPKGVYKTGDLVAYIPEGATVPDPLLQEMNMVGMLGGAAKNRVKAVKLRGELSQGLVYVPDPLPEWWELGYECSEKLGIHKEIPVMPAQFSGKMDYLSVATIRTYTDIENIKAYPDVLQPGEPVVAREKVHGSCCIYLYDDGKLYVSSKGISKRGFTLLPDETNVYWRVANSLDIAYILNKLSDYYKASALILYGEVLGVQDLMYGLQRGTVDFYAFDLWVQGRGFVPDNELMEVCSMHELKIAPHLYTGPFAKDVILALSTGPSTIPGAKHIREGLVVRAQPERSDPKLGRVILKSINPDYLTRKGDATEFE